MPESSKLQQLSRLTDKELGRLFPVTIVEYNQDWGRLFSEEKQLLKQAFGNSFFLSIEHIGSTAIPGICSKPTVDILCVIRKDTDPEYLIERFSELAYHINKRPDKPPPHLTFVKGYTPRGFEGQAYHVHIRYKGDCEEICFRDYLINNKDAASEYDQLKRELAVKYRYDREGYTDGKSEFVRKIIELAGK